MNRKCLTFTQKRSKRRLSQITLRQLLLFDSSVNLMLIGDIDDWALIKQSKVDAGSQPQINVAVL